MAEHTRTVRRAKFSPDGSMVVTASEDGAARVWSVHELSKSAIDSDRLELEDDDVNVGTIGSGGIAIGEGAKAIVTTNPLSNAVERIRRFFRGS